jgi:hypothetical protein
LPSKRLGLSLELSSGFIVVHDRAYLRGIELTAQAVEALKRHRKARQNIREML